MIQLTMPYPPSVNSIYRTFRNRIIISKEGREYIDKAIATVMEFKYKNGITQPLFHKMAVRYDVYPPDKRRRDLANLDKVLSDCLTKGGLWDDDFNIDDLRFVRKSSDPTNPRIEVTIV